MVSFVRGFSPFPFGKNVLGGLKLSALSSSSSTSEFESFKTSPGVSFRGVERSSGVGAVVAGGIAPPASSRVFITLGFSLSDLFLLTSKPDPRVVSVDKSVVVSSSILGFTSAQTSFC